MHPIIMVELTMLLGYSNGIVWEWLSKPLNNQIDVDPDKFIFYLIIKSEAFKWKINYAAQDNDMQLQNRKNTNKNCCKYKNKWERGRNYLRKIDALRGFVFSLSFLHFQSHFCFVIRFKKKEEETVSGGGGNGRANK